ncbi:MAG: DUF4235 domain-containing protein [Propionibacteriaceae bacterium]|jgi:hypothetical protein|nr:DUF4235 domain-containing protein [Propionibacteriaceae bacterium]
MNKSLKRRIYPALANLAVSLIGGLLLRRTWSLATGQEPPDPSDPKVSTRTALGWFVLSTLGLGALQLLVSRAAQRVTLKAIENGPVQGD